MKVHASRSKCCNPSLNLQKRTKKGEGNVEWIKRCLHCGSPEDGSVILVGGANLSHFRMRVAQSYARRDLLPSFWSHAAILVKKTIRLT